MKLLIVGIIIVFVLATLALLPQINIDKDAVISSSAWSWVIAAFYFFPTHTVGTMLVIIVGMGIWSIIVAVVKTVWDVLPFS